MLCFRLNKLVINFSLFVCSEFVEQLQALFPSARHDNSVQVKFYISFHP